MAARLPDALGELPQTTSWIKGRSMKARDGKGREGLEGKGRIKGRRRELEVSAPHCEILHTLKLRANLFLLGNVTHLDRIYCTT